MKNPGRQDYYDPMIEGETEAQVQLRAIGVQEPGTYILFEDFMDAIRSFALSVDNFKKQQGVHELIMWLEGTASEFGKNEETFDVDNFSKAVLKDKLEVDAERIELYPDADKKWHARTIDSNGHIIGDINDGSFDREWVEKDAAMQYPDLIIHQMESEDEDSTWNRKGPSPRIWNRGTK